MALFSGDGFPGTGGQSLASLSVALSRRSQERRGVRELQSPRKLPPPMPGAILMVDEKCRAESLAAIPALPRGSAVLLRDYHNPQRRPLTRELLKLCRRRGLRLIMAVANRKDVGFALRLGGLGVLGVCGIHVPQAALSAPARIMGSRGRFPPSWILTASVHSRAAMVTASRAGFHAALLSPVFPTTSHPGQGALGPLRFALLARNAPLPVYALGGIHAGNARRLAHSGAVGIAAIEGFALEGGRP